MNPLGSIENIPYATSPPLIFTYRQSATVAAGIFDFSGTMAKTAFTPSRPILPNVLYIFRTFTYAMDIDLADYFGAIGATGGVTPEFSLYIQSDASGPKLREPVVLANFMQNFPYIFAIFGQELLQRARPNAVAATVNQPTTFNRLLGLITGTLIEIPSLIGKGAITAIVQLTAQEVSEEEYIRVFRGTNPDYGSQGRAQGKVLR